MKVSAKLARSLPASITSIFRHSCRSLLSLAKPLSIAERFGHLQYLSLPSPIPRPRLPSHLVPPRVRPLDKVLGCMEDAI